MNEREFPRLFKGGLRKGNAVLKDLDLFRDAVGFRRVGTPRRIPVIGGGAAGGQRQKHDHRNTKHSKFFHELCRRTPVTSVMGGAALLPKR